MNGKKMASAETEKLELGLQLASHLEAALRRNGFTRREVDLLKTGNFLGEVRGVLVGTRKIVPVDGLIDLDLKPNELFNTTVENHCGSGVVKLEAHDGKLFLNGKQLHLFRSHKHNEGGGGAIGYELREEMENRGGNVSACILDYLEKHPLLWPEDWKTDDQGKRIYVCFWGDIFMTDLGKGLPFIEVGYWEGDKENRWQEDRVETASQMLSEPFRRNYYAVTTLAP